MGSGLFTIIWNTSSLVAMLVQHGNYHKPLQKQKSVKSFRATCFGSFVIKTGAMDLDNYIQTDVLIISGIPANIFTGLDDPPNLPYINSRM